MVKMSSANIPLHLSFKILNDAVLTAHDEFSHQRWDKANVEDYLRTFCINSEAVEAIIKHAGNVLSMNYLETNKTAFKVQYEAMMKWKSHCPQDFEAWMVPASWIRNFNIHQHVDVVMHLLFLGIGRIEW